MTTLKAKTGSRQANIVKQGDSFLTLLCVDTDQVVRSKFFKTMKGAERYANKFFN